MGNLAVFYNKKTFLLCEEATEILQAVFIRWYWDWFFMPRSEILPWKVWQYPNEKQFNQKGCVIEMGLCINTVLHYALATIPTPVSLPSTIMPVWHIQIKLCSTELQI